MSLVTNTTLVGAFSRCKKQRGINDQMVILAPWQSWDLVTNVMVIDNKQVDPVAFSSP